MRVKKVPKSETEFQYLFTCPGCDQEHAFNETVWIFNGDVENPTISPSFLMRGFPLQIRERIKKPNKINYFNN